MRELAAEPPGDVLVFLSGEREIRDTADALRASRCRQHRGAAAVRPAADRRAADASSTPHTGRRVVLATNVAETSLTVPGIRYVVDPGTARISRYSRRTKVQRLPIEPISQASAAQRAGRCGRVRRRHLHPALLARRTSSPGRASPSRRSCAPTSPRSSCRWPRCGSATSTTFPFLDPPDRRSVRDGVHAAAGARRVRRRRRAHRRSAGGWRSCRVDPRIGRMILAGRRRGLRARGAGHRRRAVDPRPARAARRPSRSAAAPEARPLRRRALRLHLASSTSGTTCASSGSERSGNQFRRHVPRRVPALPAHPRVAGPHRPAAQHRPRPRTSSRPTNRPPPGARARRAARRAARRTSGCAEGDSREYLGRAQLPVRPRARARC